MEHLFVYGTLGPGRPNEHILKEIGGEWQRAHVQGVLHEKGWGAALGYPGIELDENAGEVDGFIFSSNNLASHWADLDAFEGEGYRRVFTTATLENGDRIQAYIYSLMTG